MESHKTEVIPHTRRRAEAARAVPWLLAGVLVLLHSTACGPIESHPLEDPTAEHGDLARELNSDNGLAFNGLAFNGLAFNGLAFNGLAFNGLAFNGLSTTEFTSWFQDNPKLHAMVMQYVVQCAVPSGQHRTYTNPQTGKTYSWAGRLGVAPDWASGRPATEVEQQLVSACLAAHANKYAVTVSMSVLGRTATGQDIPIASDELSLYPKREACFFGNLFTGEGLYVANDGITLGSAESSPRACALLDEQNRLREQCAPMLFAGSCEQLCQQDPTNTFYVTCTYQGKTWRPVVTRLRTRDIYTCGDNRCQFTERCGSGRRYDSCRTDCGSCDEGDEDGEGEEDQAGQRQTGGPLPHVRGAGAVRRL